MAKKKQNNQIPQKFDFRAFGKMGGRPRRYDSPEEFEAAIEKYFGSISRTYPDPDGRKDNNGDIIFVTEIIEPPTITSMLNYLDLPKSTWNDYCRQPGYSAAATRAKQLIEAYLERQLMSAKHVQGIIFNLKNNFGWAEKLDVKQDLNANVQSIEAFLAGGDGVDV